MTELSIKLLRIVGLFCEIRHYYILIDRVSSILLIAYPAYCILIVQGFIHLAYFVKSIHFAKVYYKVHDFL